MRRVDLADGQWVELREKPDIKVKHRRLIQAAGGAAASAIAKMPDIDQIGDVADKAEAIAIASIPNLTRDETDALLVLGEATIVALVAGWSFPEPLPTMETVGDMDTDLYDRLQVEVAKLGAAVMMETSGFEPTPEDAPGVPSSSSSG